MAKAVTVKYGDEAVSIYHVGSNFTVKSNEIKIDSIPYGSKIVQRGARVEHFEIVLAKPMTTK